MYAPCYDNNKKTSSYSSRKSWSGRVLPVLQHSTLNPHLRRTQDRFFYDVSHRGSLENDGSQVPNLLVSRGPFSGEPCQSSRGVRLSFGENPDFQKTSVGSCYLLLNQSLGLFFVPRGWTNLDSFWFFENKFGSCVNLSYCDPWCCGSPSSRLAWLTMASDCFFLFSLDDEFLYHRMGDFLHHKKLRWDEMSVRPAPSLGDMCI